MLTLALLIASLPGVSVTPKQKEFHTGLRIPAQCVTQLKALTIKKPCEQTSDPSIAICEGKFAVKYSCVEAEKKGKKK